MQHRYGLHQYSPIPGLEPGGGIPGGGIPGGGIPGGGMPLPIIPIGIPGGGIPGGGIPGGGTPRPCGPPNHKTDIVIRHPYLGKPIFGLNEVLITKLLIIQNQNPLLLLSFADNPVFNQVLLLPLPVITKKNCPHEQT